ncbi:hypothetical protein I6F26_08285 [Ensifer sp. IC3342]|nr:hypothetical protein [Ensifer sp. BRP08]MCA1446576.1 hypothetical protein [Ensifer sp. IC3342]
MYVDLIWLESIKPALAAAIRDFIDGKILSLADRNNDAVDEFVRGRLPHTGRRRICMALTLVRAEIYLAVARPEMSRRWRDL